MEINKNRTQKKKKQQKNNINQTLWSSIILIKLSQIDQEKNRKVTNLKSRNVIVITRVVKSIVRKYYK